MGEMRVSTKIPRQYPVEHVIEEKKKKHIDEIIHKNRSGIYAIVNRVNNNKYIGQASNLFERRKAHFNELVKNCHFNPHLQNAYNQCGSHAFVFIVLEYVRIVDLNIREQYWIDELKPQYNCILNLEEGMTHYDPRPIEPMYIREGETFQRPAWHAWVYGGARNPLLDVSRK